MSAIIKECLKSYHELPQSIRMDLDSAVDVILENNNLNSEELKIIDYIKRGYSLPDIGKELGVSRLTISRRLHLITAKISEVLGSGYDDAHIIELVEAKIGRELTEEEIQFCWYQMKNFGFYQNKSLSIFNFRKDNERFKIPSEE